jgi:hypothetical protein
MAGKSHIYEQVRDIVRDIPYGQVALYCQVASLVGEPDRSVGLRIPECKSGLLRPRRGAASTVDGKADGELVVLCKVRDAVGAAM